MDIMLAFYFGSAVAIYFSLLGAIVVMCQTAWPIVFVLFPLAYVYFSYQVCVLFGAHKKWTHSQFIYSAVLRKCHCEILPAKAPAG